MLTDSADGFIRVGELSDKVINDRMGMICE